MAVRRTKLLWRKEESFFISEVALALSAMALNSSVAPPHYVHKMKTPHTWHFHFVEMVQDSWNSIESFIFEWGEIIFNRKQALKIQ